MINDILGAATFNPAQKAAEGTGAAITLLN